MRHSSGANQIAPPFAGPSSLTSTRPFALPIARFASLTKNRRDFLRRPSSVWNRYDITGSSWKARTSTSATSSTSFNVAARAPVIASTYLP